MAALWLLFMLRRAPKALEGGPRERQHLLGVGREDSEWRRRTTKDVLPEDIEVWASLLLGRSVVTLNTYAPKPNGSVSRGLTNRLSTKSAWVGACRR